MPDADTIIDPRTANFDGDVVDSVDLTSNPIALIDVALKRLTAGMYTSSYESQIIEDLRQAKALLVFDKFGMSEPQRVAFMRRYHIAHESNMQIDGSVVNLDTFVSEVRPTFGMDGAVIIPWFNMFLVIEKDGHCHS